MTSNEIISFGLDIFIMLFCFSLFVYSAVLYHHTHNLDKVHVKFKKLIQIGISVFFAYTLIQCLYIINYFIPVQDLAIYDSIGFVFMLAMCLFGLKIVESRVRIERGMINKMTKHTKDILDFTGADRVGIIEFEGSFAHMRYLSYHDSKYDISIEWQRMPLGTIKMWTEPMYDGNWLNIEDSSTYQDEGMRETMIAYNHRSLYQLGLMCKGAYIGYIAIMYVSKQHKLTDEQRQRIAQIAKCIENYYEDSYCNK